MEAQLWSWLYHLQALLKKPWAPSMTELSSSSWLVHRLWSLEITLAITVTRNSLIKDT